MKSMLLGIFLLLLSIWGLIYGTLDDLLLPIIAGVLLPIPSIIAFLAGWFSETHKKN